MECRDVRPHLSGLDRLADGQRAHIVRHIAGCAACRDEAVEPVASILAGSRLPLAHPPPGFTQNIVLRLPAEAPAVLAQKAEQRRRRWYTGLRAVGALLFAVAVLGLVLLHLTSVQAREIVPTITLPLALVAKAVLNALGQPIVTLLTCFALLGGAWWLTRGQRWRPTGERALAAAALALLLVLNAAGTRGNVRMTNGESEITGPVAGSVTNIAGSIRVRGTVHGDVVSLLGDVYLEPGAVVEGSVMSGAGTVLGAEGGVAGSIIRSPIGGLAAASVTGSGETATFGSNVLTAIAGFVLVLVTLLVAALVVVTMPQVVLEAGRNLLRFPGRAVTFGVAASAGLLVLALGGSMLLAASVVGVVLVPVLLLLLHLPYIAGIAAVGQLLGSRLAGRATTAGSLWGVGAQVAVVMALSLWQPWLGLVLFYVLGSAGFGAGLLVPRERLFRA